MLTRNRKKSIEADPFSLAIHKVSAFLTNVQQLPAMILKNISDGIMSFRSRYKRRRTITVTAKGHATQVSRTPKIRKISKVRSSPKARRSKAPKSRKKVKTVNTHTLMATRQRSIRENPQ